ncbi:MAG: sortase [Ruminococcus sp.]|nr:sortase [Ruminococcus sp.]
MKIKRGTYLCAAGTVLLAAALFLLLYNKNEDNRAASKTTDILQELKDQMPEPHTESKDVFGMDIPGMQTAPVFTEPFDGSEYTQQAQSSTIPKPDLFAEYEVDQQPEEVYYYVNEISYMGLIYIPSLNLELPVMSDWSYPNLRNAPCRYSGTVADGDLIIAAHNYRCHFGRISELDSGDEIIFIDGEGIMHTYNVVQSELIDGKNSAAMVSGSDDWDITLFTCTYSGASRVTVRAALAQQED